jgi:hypothetical protein
MMTCSPIRALMILPSILLVGCANPWAANFQPNPAYRGRGFPPTESVQVRTIDYERFRRYAERERELSIQSTTAPEDLSADEQLASRKRLLEALQIPDPGDHVMVLGWSEFSTTDKLDPYSKPLRDFAHKIGADYVVVTSAYLGPVTTVVREPVTTYTHGYTTVAPDRRGRPRSLSYSDTSTTWVPVSVTEDAYYYRAFFLRKVRPDDAG